MYRLEWQDTRTYEIKDHGLYETEADALQAIKDWWKSNDFMPPYYRIMHNPLGITIDYGSHYCFYHITKQEDN